MLRIILGVLATPDLVSDAQDVSHFRHVQFTRLLTSISKHFFTFATVVVPVADLLFLLWCILKAKGVGPLIYQQGTLHGSELAWSMVSGAMSCISNKVTLVTNAPDFSSRARYPSAAVYPQLLTMPLTYTILSFMGVLVSSSSTVLYGKAVWSPVDLLGMFLDDHPTAATRVGVSSTRL